MRTRGLSPKLIPALAALAVGAIVALTIDHTAGLAIIATATSTLAGGYTLPPGNIEPRD